MWGCTVKLSCGAILPSHCQTKRNDVCNRQGAGALAQARVVQDFSFVRFSRQARVSDWKQQLMKGECMRGYSAAAARLTPDQKVGSSNLSGLILLAWLSTQTQPIVTKYLSLGYVCPCRTVFTNQDTADWNTKTLSVWDAWKQTKSVAMRRSVAREEESNPCMSPCPVS